MYNQCLLHFKDYGFFEQGDAAELNIEKN